MPKKKDEKKKKRRADLLDTKVKGKKQANPRHTVPGQFAKDLILDVTDKLNRAMGK